MNFSLNSGTMNSNFLQNKLNNAVNSQQQQQQQQHYLSQPLAPRFMGLNNLNANSFSLSPTMSNQIKNNLGLGQQQQQQQQHMQQQSNDSFNMQRNSFQQINPSNLLYPLNLNNLNLNNLTNNNNNNNNNIANNVSQLQQQLTNPTLLASVLAANTSCSLNNTLFVGNLHASLQEMDLVQVFRPFGRIVECCKKWLHFGFVKFTSEEEACHAYVTLNGFRLKGRPMRLEFQNRTKKARIKAILAQATLQANQVNNQINDAVDSSLASLGFSGFMNEPSLQFTNQISIGTMHQHKNHLESFSSSSSLSTGSSSLSNDCTFFDADHIMKFANTNIQSSTAATTADLDLEPKMKKFSDDFNQLISYDFNEKCIEEAFLGSFKKNNLTESPDNSCALSSSSDSGCRSTSSLAEEDSGIASLQSTKVTCTNSSSTANKINALTSENLKTLNGLENNKNKVLLNKPVNEEHQLSDDDDECVSNSDTSDDASEIPTDSECLNDLDLLDEIETLSDQCQDCVIEPKKYNQIIEKDGSLARKKLEYGIYRSINQTFSLFIEPQDILKKLDSDEYDEYVLFPNGIDMIDSYFIIKNNRLVA